MGGSQGDDPHMRATTTGWLAGIDIGGTKISVCIGTQAGQVLAARRLDVAPSSGPAALLFECLRSSNALLQECAAHAREQTGQSDIAAWGVTCPGPFRYRDGVFLDPPNMPRWHGFRLRDWLSEHVHVPLGLLHDAKASILAERYWGAARGVENAVFLTVSTGCGAGLLLDGRIINGAAGFAGEVGHIRLNEDGPVGFGRRGTVEGYGSGPGIVQVGEAERLACRQRGESTLLDAAGPTLSCEAICAAARAGDGAATRVMDRCTAQLGRLMAMMVDLLNPECFVLGTIGSAYFDLFEPRLRAAIDADALCHSAAMVRILPSGLADRGNQSALAVALSAMQGELP